MEKRKERDEKRALMNRVTDVKPKQLNPLMEYRKTNTSQTHPI